MTNKELSNILNEFQNSDMHICEENPCTVQDKEITDRLKVDFETVYMNKDGNIKDICSNCEEPNPNILKINGECGVCGGTGIITWKPVGKLITKERK